MASDSPHTEVKIVRQLATVEREQWDALVGPTGSPFLEWDWLSGLEESGCVAPATGWAPHHLTVWRAGRLVAAAPLYLKDHSQGEFVFDHGWADAAIRAGLAYYPKLLVAVPFTPATGRRLLTHPAEPRAPLLRVLAEALRDLCESNRLSSVHVNFCAFDEVAPLAAAGFLARDGLQYHWHNCAYADFDAYLAALDRKRRQQIRAERRAVARSGIEVAVHEGAAIPDELFAPMFRIYRSTVEKFYWGRQYLNEAFFEHLRRRVKRHLCFVAARHRGRVIAGAFNVQKAGVLYGRYWGALRDVRFLHFEVCYYTGIAHCIARGLERFEPGAGGEFKHRRGFLPAVTRSMHYVADPAFAAALRRFLAGERAAVAGAAATLRARSPLRADDDGPG